MVIVLTVCTKDKHTASFIFTDFENRLGWSNDGVAWCIGLLTSVYAYFSLDSAIHFTEEVIDAPFAIPRASKSKSGN